MSNLETFIQTWEREYEITLRVLNSYPPDRLDYRPHEKSVTARDLMWTFPFEDQEYIAGCARGRIETGRSSPPDTKDQIVRDYKRIHRDAVKQLRAVGEEVLSRTMKFSIAKGELTDVSVGEILWFFLHDQIHHRGQLSVYLRLVGAQVPSIYGPSADEPWYPIGTV